MTFTPSCEIKVSVLPEQREWVGTPEMIGRAVQREDTVAFDIWDENQLVGFVLLRKFQEGEWFLWEYSSILSGIRIPAAEDPWA